MIAFKFQEIMLNLKRRFGGHISLNSEFVNDVESGLYSRNFNIISKNNDDGRAGLDDKSKQEIKNIMENEQVSFDKARLLFTERKFKDNAIGPDGMPLDPKAVTFSR
ncbi:hypothetical protein KAFR_0H03100 [Kazachstania africana CBS 2517]|uniref:Uncharacterized protein n=1 Tax=Kazachstania africana (strain ATCC 22294 / BCRC 22015 / CBS 2517 / CECT 1963 / NBRC 1671 / NRRL Y-8276) TaxID=1071382 RepID=H2AZG4_KAZAF|nr:hypothetical protein KAFR_0H03100 [Kazachstania africana CBS 2517]CCF59720.1 hypothetical protein KAFR_0H03100 [Kazachstania africana CBS 2517]